MFELTNNYFRWTCLTFPTTVVAKATKAMPYLNLAIYDVILAVKPQDLDLRNQTTPCGGESGHETNYDCVKHEKCFC